MGSACRRDKWVGRVIRTQSLTHGTRMFLVHVLAEYMDCEGFVSRPRESLAAQAGISARQVARYVEMATTNGWLVLVAGGFKTMTAEYQATYPNEQRVSYRVTHSVPKGDASIHPLRRTNTSPFPRSKGDASRHTSSWLPIRPARPFRNLHHDSHYRTQPRTVEWHRCRASVAAQVEKHSGGRNSATRSVCLLTIRTQHARFISTPANQEDHMPTIHQREANIAYVAKLATIAFYAARGIGLLPNLPHRLSAINAAARIILTDETGGDLDSVREIASATLIGQDFRAETVALFLDDLTHDAAGLAREQRAVAP